MANRVVYGNTRSENGWPMVDTGSCEWVRIPGTNVTLQIQRGWPSAIMRAFAADYNANIEPLRDPDSACWTPTNSVGTSNHLSGTGMDLNWQGADGNTFRLGISKERAYPGDKARKLDELLDFYEGMIFCGGEWSIRDWMHFQMGGNTYGQQRTGDFIARKIRADGYSTYRRGNAALPGDPALILSRATGVSLNKAQEILPAVQDGLIQSDCKTPLRIAMWLAQHGHESDNFNATEEYDKGDGGKTERWIYLGRTWIQLTWLSAYRGFGQWCFSRGLVADPEVFVKNPKSLADLKWAGLGGAYYWTTTVRSTRKYPTLNQASDAGDVLVATQIINGGTNGLEDSPSGAPGRRTRYNRALALGDELLQILNGGDDLASVPQDQWDRVYRELTQQLASRSLYATPGEKGIDTLAGFALNVDKMEHEKLVEKLAVEYGDDDAIFRIARVAGGQGRDTSAWAVGYAKKVLAKIPAEFLTAFQERRAA